MGLAGQKLGQYEIIEEIGKGGMAIVYRASQPSMKREVAIKMMFKSLQEQDATFIERFRREAEVIAKLQHPHILPVYDFGEHDGQPYLVMAYLGGGSLAQRINRENAMSIKDTVRILRPVAAALDFAHEHAVIHRDFKPGNVMFDKKGYAYLTDFGLAKMAESSQLTASAGIIGTPDYMAPDWGKKGDITPSVDIYALGVTVYQMLAGTVPYPASTPMGALMAHSSEPIPDIRIQRDDLPDGVQEIIAMALAKTPAERFPTAEMLIDALESLITASTPAPMPTPATPMAAPAPAEADPLYPNMWVRWGLMALEKELGPADLATILVEAGAEHWIQNPPPDNFKKEVPLRLMSRILHTVRVALGDEVGLPLLRRAGSGTMAQGMPANKVAVSIFEAAARLASPELRMWLGLQAMARQNNSLSDQHVELEDHADHWLWRNTTNCPDCCDTSLAAPPCEYFMGMIEFMCEFASVGKHYRITEVACQASGAASCDFRIDKTPIG
jgi:serine/threonine-protein kinase